MFSNMNTTRKVAIALVGVVAVIALMALGFSVGFSVGNTQVEFSGKSKDELLAAAPTPYSGVVYSPTLSPDPGQTAVEMGQSVKFTLMHQKNPDDDTQYDYEMFLHGNDNAPGDFDGLVRLDSCDEDADAYTDSIEPGDSITLMTCEGGNVGIEIVALVIEQGREYRTDYNMIVAMPMPPNNASLSSLTMYDTDDSSQVFLNIDSLPANPPKRNVYHVRIPSDVTGVTTVGDAPHPAIEVDYPDDIDHALDGGQSEMYGEIGESLVIARLGSQSIRYAVEMMRNAAPQIEAIASQVMALGGDDHVIAVTASDPDGYIVSYEAASSDSDRVSVSVAGNILTLTAHEHVSEDDPVFITVRVRDNTESVSIGFAVTVPEAEDSDATEDTDSEESEPEAGQE